MSDQDAGSRAGAAHVYRRIPPNHWKPKTGERKPGAFIPREGTSLSVFAADLQTPRGVLQHCIDDLRRKLTSTDPAQQERAASQLARHGDTVEQMVANGWRVLLVPRSAFTERGFTLTEPEADGHQNVVGEYLAYAEQLAELSILLSPEECLREAPPP